MIFNNIKFNLLNHSQEVYIGDTAPLTNTLISYSAKLKELLGDETKVYDFKNDKKLINNIIALCNEFGKNIAENINAESVTIVVNPSRRYNASMLNMILDNNVTIDDNGESFIKLSTYENLECITLTKEGYKFKNKKNKYIFIKLNHGAILESSVREIAAIICHELGHAFENGVFGCLKGLSDSALRNQYNKMIDTLTSSVDSTISHLYDSDSLKVFRFLITFPFEFIYTILGYIVGIIISPLLGTAIFTKLSLLIKEKVFNRIITSSTYKIADNVEDINSIDNKTRNIISSNAELIDIDRKEKIEDLRKEILEDYKQFDVNKVTSANKPIATIGKSIVKFMSDCDFNIMTSTKNFLDLITLTDYMNNVHNKTVFHKKYEYFADIFASVYGFSKEVNVTNYKFDNDSNSDLDTKLLTELYKIPIFGTINEFNRYVTIRKYRSNDEHGTADQRAKAIYTNLIYTLKNDSSLSSIQKKELLEKIKQMEETDNDIIAKRKKYNLLIKMHDRMVLERLDGNMDDDVVEKILKPMDEVLKKELKK